MKSLRIFAVALALLWPAACGGGDKAPSATPASSEPAPPPAGASSPAKSGWPCASIDVATVNGIFGDQPELEERGSAIGVLPIEGATTCTFHDAETRTVTVSGATNMPNEYDAYVKNVKSDPNLGTKFKDLSGIGDHAVGAVSRKMAAEVILESGNNLAVVVCIDTNGDADLYEHCKELATRIGS
jgi:hypothetical protein